MEERKICTHCGTEIEVTDGEYFNGQFYCRACLEELTITCENCGERIWREDSVEDRICQHCYDNHYSRCEGCGDLIHNDEANYYNGYVYCDDCYNSRHHEVVEDYDYKPDPIFYGDGQPHYVSHAVQRVRRTVGRLVIAALWLILKSRLKTPKSGT